MSILKLGRVLRASVFALALPGLATSGAHALEEIGENLEISGEVFVLTELTWGDTSGPKTFNIFTDVSRTRNQIYLPRGAASTEEILVRQRLEQFRKLLDSRHTCNLQVYGFRRSL